MPKRAHYGDAGIDLYSTYDLKLHPGCRRTVSTGIAIAIPYGMVGLIHPRSGVAASIGLSIVNSPGTIDSGYRGEIKVPLINLDPSVPIYIKRGDRIAQILIQQVELINIIEAESFGSSLLLPISRGKKGNGSSGRGKNFD